jgi:hypothetical protein
VNTPEPLICTVSVFPADTVTSAGVESRTDQQIKSPEVESYSTAVLAVMPELVAVQVALVVVKVSVPEVLDQVGVTVTPAVVYPFAFDTSPLRVAYVAVEREVVWALVDEDVNSAILMVSVERFSDFVPSLNLN